MDRTSVAEPAREFTALVDRVEISAALNWIK
jgi:hypothetical protein